MIYTRAYIVYRTIRQLTRPIRAKKNIKYNLGILNNCTFATLWRNDNQSKENRAVVQTHNTFLQTFECLMLRSSHINELAQIKAHV